MTTLNVTSCC